MGSRQIKPKNLLILGAIFLLIQCGENKPSEYEIEVIYLG